MTRLHIGVSRRSSATTFQMLVHVDDTKIVDRGSCPGERFSCRVERKKLPTLLYVIHGGESALRLARSMHWRSK